MQLAYLIPIWELAAAPAFGEPPEPLDEGLLLHAAASRARAAVAMMAAAARAAGTEGTGFMPAVLRSGG
jgi:hypothetical protein